MFHPMDILMEEPMDGCFENIDQEPNDHADHDGGDDEAAFLPVEVVREM